MNMLKGLVLHCVQINLRIVLLEHH